MRQIFIPFLFICTQATSYGQSPSYQDLTPLMNFIKSSRCCDECLLNNEKELLEKLRHLNWDFDNSSTFEYLYQQTKNENLDYRYYLLLAKATSHNTRKVDDYYDKSKNIINYYYKSLFLKLAVEQCNRSFRIKDSLKYEYTNQYILSTLKDSCFPSQEAFSDFATQNVKYCKELLNAMTLNLGKEQKSELYYIIADGLYETEYAESNTQENLSDIIKYLSLALKENPQNWRALNSRAERKQNDLKDYQAAIKDYIQLINMFESENKIHIENHNKWLKQQKLSAEDHKSLVGITPTYERMFDVVDCYMSLNDYKSSLIWLDKSLLSIQQYRQYSRHSEFAANYEGLIYYFKAIAHFELKQKFKACEEVEKAINLGYDLTECKKIQDEMNCISNPLINENMTSVPMKKVNGVYEIPITINEVLKLNFILDAGATDVSISPDVALTLIRSGTVSNTDFIGTSTYRFADGSSAKSKVFIIRKIQIGDKIISNIKASISNSLDAPLLLGQSVLNKFGKVTIDYKMSVIYFENE